MTLTQSLLSMAGGVVLLLAGAEGLVRGASALALRLGITPLVVGLTVVAVGTSSPELVVSVQAALAGRGGVAIGNVVGSNVANLGLIVGLSAALSPMRVDRGLTRQDMPVMLGGMVVLSAFLLDGTLEQWEGGLLLVGAVVYTVLKIAASRRSVRAEREALPPEIESALADTQAGFKRHVLFVVGGIALLVWGSDLLLDGAVELATTLGVSEAVVGLTIVALGTSLPELATTVVAALRGEGEIALGNAVGSNIYNVLSVLGPAALAAPMAAVGVGVDVLVVMLGFGLLTLTFLLTGGKTQRWEGAVLLLAYVGYLWWVATG
ncbi:calcium/sodium antiporter [Rubrivirga sp. S365]|uniref:Calcium/sodium antiporter n=1 Tax=Rubrivirga litoralis TaxID=3075598 RepID=A0ABU3BT89_9BACT|nr:MULTISPECIES: calcium/sodium antiporter [unclassified Rubrivirga]MDT0632497.1 calcium/sodium antiporter [Rubrivirga sp. F394]MDT7857997.1 calcium/sodium antiporter [Rubrivirga sp. S365]